jgi:hypothetical protein
MNIIHPHCWHADAQPSNRNRLSTQQKNGHRLLVYCHIVRQPKDRRLQSAKVIKRFGEVPAEDVLMGYE